MMKKLLILLTLIFALACTCTAFAGAGTDKNANMEKLTSTSAGDLYLDKDNLQALRQGDKLFLLLSAELRYNKEMLPKLQATKPELKTAISMTQIYLYNNDGTQYALLKSLYTDKDDNVVYTIEGSPKLQPVKSKLQMLLYERALTVMENQKRIADMLRRKA